MNFFSIIWCLIGGASAWNLATFDDSGLQFATNNNDYEIVHVSLFYVRSFLTIRNLSNSSNHHITLIESTWPENLLPIQSRIFPNELSHAKHKSDCNGIVKTIQTAVDRTDGHLWLLDNGSQYCTPKLIVFDLLRSNIEIHRYLFTDLKNDALKSIQLYIKDDMDANNNAIVKRSSTATTYALILIHQSKFLIQYSLSDNRPKKLFLIIPLQSGAYDILIAAEITIKNNDELVVKDYNNNLWIAKLNEIKYSSIQSKNIDLFVEVKFLGPLLGSANALAIPQMVDDIDQYMYYYLPRDGAVVRWNFRFPGEIRAEGHEVLYLTKSSIVQIVFGAKASSVWIVHAHADEIGDHCRRILNFRTLNGSRRLFS
ncbi:uncharacterized protein LOC116352610 [Contarinia nasturtii]|uniref:uncharacterized protein LOC116352610 n=1 Tax=Contarinia nasturtii TaxID=265458 RepID=UPI0012D4226B|nr:uncharacterized protein LOC116352610 [Contarinia nasturtii]